jgi:hypothetical protein
VDVIHIGLPKNWNSQAHDGTESQNDPWPQPHAVHR